MIAGIAFALGASFSFAQETPRTVDRVLAVVGAQVVTERDARVRVFEMRLFDRSLELASDEELTQRAVGEAVDDVLLAFWAEGEIGEMPKEEGVAAARDAWRRYESLAGSPAKLEQRLADAGIPARVFRIYAEERARERLGIRAAVVRSIGSALLPQGRDEVRDAKRIRLGQILFVPIATGDARSETRSLEHALMVRREIAEGLPFDRAAMIYSEDTSGAANGGDLGWIERATLADALRDALANLDAGEVSAPIRTRAGYHLLRIADFESPVRIEAARRLAEEEDRQLKKLRAETHVVTAEGIVLDGGGAEETSGTVLLP